MAIYMWREYDGLCFTANTAGSVVMLWQNGAPTAVTFQTSTDWNTRTDYTLSTNITLSNEGDKVYFRNKSETQTGLNDGNNRYQFEITGWVDASWDIWYLLCKNWASTLTSNYCFAYLFATAWLKTPPPLKFTTLTEWCYQNMFRASWITSLPSLPATTLPDMCYQQMFFMCSNIKLSTTQDGTYTNEYRIPTTWTGTEWAYSLNSMFYGTWWTFTSDPTINTTYYTSNQVI